MKILVIGCGSIGQRHIKNLLKIGGVTILAFDTDKKKLKQVKKITPRVNISSELDSLWNEKPKVCFVTTPTALHLKYALLTAARGCHLFMEKPLAASLKDVNSLLNLVKRRKLITLVGCNMRFYWAIAKIKQLIEKKIIGRIISARIEAGQYLPDWHLGQDYRKFYSAKKKLGGGVILDAIHELDYALWFFGKPEKLKAFYGKLGRLEIETEDVAEIIMKFKKGPLVNIHMDYLQHPYGRNCKLIGEKGTIIWDINEHKIRLYSVETKKWKIFTEPKGYDFNQCYIDEAKYFLKCLRNNSKTFNSVFLAAQTLETALKVKYKGTRVKI